MQEGEKAPNFELNADDGSLICLDSFKEKENIVLCFYPKKHLFACPSQKVFKMVGSVFSVHKEILSTDSVLFAISMVTVEVQKRIVDEYNIPYRHLSDPNKGTCKNYASLNIVGLAKRSTCIVDKKGIIRKIFRDVDVENHGKVILEFLKQLN